MLAYRFSRYQIAVGPEDARGGQRVDEGRNFALGQANGHILNGHSGSMKYDKYLKLLYYYWNTGLLFALGCPCWMGRLFLFSMPLRTVGLLGRSPYGSLILRYLAVRTGQDHALSAEVLRDGTSVLGLGCNSFIHRMGSLRVS